MLDPAVSRWSIDGCGLEERGRGMSLLRLLVLFEELVRDCADSPLCCAS